MLSSVRQVVSSLARPSAHSLRPRPQSSAFSSSSEDSLSSESVFEFCSWNIAKISIHFSSASGTSNTGKGEERPRVKINSPEDAWSKKVLEGVLLTPKEESEGIWGRDHTAISTDGLVLSWHPNRKHPYEHTKPVPRDLSELKEGDSVLKVHLREEWGERHLTAGPSNNDLQNMFYTNKHEWYPRYKEWRLRSTTRPAPKYREGL